MKQTATLKPLSGNLGRSVKLILTLLFLNFFVQNVSAQKITVDGTASDWSNFCDAHVQDIYNQVNVDTVFDGDNKDFYFANEWRWKVGNAKDKNDIANGAAMLTNTVDTGIAGVGDGVKTLNGSFLVFAGDRISNGGDAQIGFWFFQNGTAPTTIADVNLFDPEKKAATALTPGDILVLADFTGGGRTATVIVLEWTPGVGTYPNSDNNFTEVDVEAAVAENNFGNTAVPSCWNFYNKQTGSTTTYSQNQFYEGYIDLSIFGEGAVFCPSTFMLETRASQSITSTLDDFVGGPLAGSPSCDITGNNTVCQGVSTCFTVTGGSSYAWSGPGGFTSTSAVICNITAGGTYNVTVTNQTGCTSTCNRVLTVIPTPNCSIAPANQTICSYQTASFTATGGGTYSWSGPGGFTSSSAVISNLTASGTYSVTITSATGGCTSSCSRTLLRLDPQPCNISPANQTICSYQTASFTASGGNSYSWSGPGGFTANTAVISNLTASGTYSVTITGAGNCTSSCSRTLVRLDPQPCDISPANTTICSYQTASFTASGGTSYSWSGPGGFTANTAVISNLTASGTYSVTVTGAGNCTSSCSRTLVRLDPQPCNIAPENQTICAGSSASFTASGGTSYSWSGPGGFTANTAVISNLTANGTYSVTVTGAGNCTSSCSRTLTVVANPECSISPANQTICSYQTASFTATGGSSYSWSGPGGFTANTAVISNLTASGTYSVTITAGANCTSSCSRTLLRLPPQPCDISPANQTICSYQTASFTATGGTSYAWSGPGGFTANSAIISNLTASGTYTVTVTGAGNCTSSCSRTLLRLDPQPCNILPGNQTICTGATASFTATGGNSYSWAGPGGFTANTAVISNVSAAGTYSVTVTGANNCTSSCSRTLTLIPNVTANAGADPASQCRDASIVGGVLTFGTNIFNLAGASVNPSPPATASWAIAPGGNPNGYTVIIGDPTSLTPSVSISGNVNGGTVTLRLTANSNSTCPNHTDDITLTLIARPLLKQVIGSEFCTNVTTTGSVTLVASQTGVSYQLQNDALQNVQAPQVGTGGNLVWNNLAPGNYTVLGTTIGSNCDSRSGPGEVDENLPTETEITPVAPLCTDAGCVSLTAVPSGGTFSGTGVSNGQFCTTGLAPGGYTVSYVYTNADGCTSTSTTVIDVQSCGEPLCTYTQGAFGNEGGQDCDGTEKMPTIDLINQAIDNATGDMITIGCGTKKVTITTGQAQCVIDKLPGGGPSKELDGDYTICNIPDAKMKNTLLAQTITLGLNINITSPSLLSDFALQAGTLYTADLEGDCGSDVAKLRECIYDPITGELVDVKNEYLQRTFSQALIDAIVAAGYPATVGGLFSLASDALCNKDLIAGTERGVSLSEIGGAAGSINEIFDECRVSQGWDLGPCPETETVAPPRITVSAASEAVNGAVQKLNVVAYPNPYRNNVRFVIQSPVAGQAVLEVYNITGQKLETLYNGRIGAHETRAIDYRPAITTGMMIYKLRIGNQQVTGKLIGLRQ